MWVERETMPKYIPCKHWSEEICSGYINIRRSSFGRMVLRGKEGHFLMIKWSTDPKYRKVKCNHNDKVSNYIKENLIKLKGETHISAIVFGNFNTIFYW